MKFHRKEIMNSLILIALLTGAIGGAVGYVARKIQSQREAEGAEAKAAKIIDGAKGEAKDILLKSKDEAIKEKEEAKKELKESETRLIKKEEAIDQKLESLDSRYKEIDTQRQNVEDLKREVLKIKGEQQEKLQKVAGLKKEEAKNVLFEMIEKEEKEEILKRVRAGEERAKEEADKAASKIIVEAIQRYAAPVTTENVVTTVALPSDELKGRIIGREGRNIQAFEKITGVDVIVDDTPEAVVLSCFDPVRREVARVTLEKLIKDGRIHPGRIEEVVEEAKKQVGGMIKEAGEQALYEVGITGINPDLVKILGRLRFRTSYGQNVLRHSIEVAFLAELIAQQLGVDTAIAKKGGLFHDIGKALDHQIEGSHAIIGRDVGKKYNLDAEVIHAIEAHHNEVAQKTVYPAIVQAADAISSARPGARRETLETYVKRLEELENIANSFSGVEKSFAIQAGREVRIFVKPQEVDDLGAMKLAKGIAKKIEDELKYPGEIKVNVIREVRATEIAK